MVQIKKGYVVGSGNRDKCMRKYKKNSKKQLKIHF